MKSNVSIAFAAVLAVASAGPVIGTPFLMPYIVLPN
jgi:hypothetical protein